MVVSLVSAGNLNADATYSTEVPEVVELNIISLLVITIPSAGYSEYQIFLRNSIAFIKGVSSSNIVLLICTTLSLPKLSTNQSCIE